MQKTNGEEGGGKGKENEEALLSAGPSGQHEHKCGLRCFFQLLLLFPSLFLLIILHYYTHPLPFSFSFFLGFPQSYFLLVCYILAFSSCQEKRRKDIISPISAMQL